MAIDPPGWVRDAIFYQIFPDRFAASERVPKPGPLEPWAAPPTRHGFKGGDLLGIAERIPYLVDLGINALYLTPIFASASNHRYHTYDYFRVDPLLGGDAALRELLDTAHAAGVRVILDGVFNHVGRGFWAFHHLLETGPASPYRSWFHVDVSALERGLPIDAYPETHARRRAVAGADGGGGEDGTVPHGGDGSSPGRLGYQAWWDLPALPKLNLDEPAVREHLLSAAEHWLRFGIDGWRLDVPEEIPDATFWAEFRRRCRAVNPEAYLVGEIWHVAPEWVGGDRFDALMNYPLAEAILGFAAGDHLDEAVLSTHHEYGRRVTRLDGRRFAQRLAELASAYDRSTVEAQLNLLDSHDTPRFLTLCGGDRDAYRLAVLLQATLPGAPCIYYGDEVGVEGGNDPDCRRAFPWDVADQDVELRSFVRAAIRARHDEPVLRRGDVRIVGAAGDAIAFERSGPEGRVLIAVNAGARPVEIPLRGIDGETNAPRNAPLEPVTDDIVIPLPGWRAPQVRRDANGALSAIAVAGRSGAVLRAP